MRKVVCLTETFLLFSDRSPVTFQSQTPLWTPCLTRAAADSALPVQLWDPEDKWQPIQEPLIVAREAPQSPPASAVQWAALRRPVWTTEPLFPPHPASVCRPPPPHPPTLQPLHMLINRPYWQIWIPLGFDWRRPLASINFASGVLSAALKGGIKWCELLWVFGVWGWVKTWLLSLRPGAR